MENFSRNVLLSATLFVVLLAAPSLPAWAQSPSPSPTGDCNECYPSTPTPTPTPTPSPSASPSPTPNPSASTTPLAGANSSGGSISDLAGQRFNQMITNRVLGNVLLGVNEQVNCNDCVSAFGSAGSVSAGIHRREKLTPHLSLLARIGHAPYHERSYRGTTSPICAV